MQEEGEDIRKTIAKARKHNLESGLSAYVFGKVPPQARDMEEAILGAMMLEVDAVPPMIKSLSEEVFYVEAHQLVFRAIKSLFDRAEPVDLLTVCEELRKLGLLERVGGAYAVTDITNRVTSAANIESHSRTILEKYMRRQTIKMCSKAIEEAYDDSFDTHETINGLSENTKNVFTFIQKDRIKSFAAMVDETTTDIRVAAEAKEEVTGLKTGNVRLDSLTNGRPRGELIIIGARPGMGKTSFINEEILNAAEKGERIAVFSLETAFKRWITNSLANRMHVDNRNVGRGDIDLDRMQKHADELKKLGIFLFSSVNLHIQDVQGWAYTLKRKYDISRIYIDYLQLMAGSREKNSNREQEISNISRGCKAITLEQDIPVIALSQLTRKLEDRADKRPMLSDLRESGAIEQDADGVHFLYRPEYYGLLKEKNTQANLRGVMEYIIAKNRNGRLESVFFDYVAEYGHFSERDAPAGGQTTIATSTPFSPDKSTYSEQTPW